MIIDVETDPALDRAADPGSYVRAILNILADFSAEKTRLADVQKAMLNILEDSGAEKLGLEAAQKATLNILEDFSVEKARLEETQKAALNILEDFDAEKNKVEWINREMAREIGERKQAEEALEAANKELEAFSYSVSHDLRAPLRAIDGYTRILLEDYEAALDDEGKRISNVIRAEAQRMGNLIDDLLKLSRLSRSEMQKASIDMTRLVNSIFGTLVKPEGRARVDFRMNSLPDAFGDPTQMQQVWTNLLANAIKFTSRREWAVIEVSGSRNENECVYYVRDNGAGFDMKYAGKLFGVFQRLHSESEFEGTGVGLAIVQRVIHRHGGRVWAEGEPDKGATFHFAIPEKGDDHD